MGAPATHGETSVALSQKYCRGLSLISGLRRTFRNTRAACPSASRTMKQVSVSSAIQGGGKRRASGLSVIALSLTRDCKPRKATDNEGKRLNY